VLESLGMVQGGGQRQLRLADAAWAMDSDQAIGPVGQHLTQLRQFLLSTYEGRRWQGQAGQLGSQWPGAGSRGHATTVNEPIEGYSRGVRLRVELMGQDAAADLVLV
jgi:hypothetical protein